MAEFEVLKAFLLVLVRLSTMIAVAPVLSSQNLPVIAKAGLALFGAALITPTLLPLPAPLPDELLALAYLAAGEAMVGIIIGFIMSLVFSAIQVGGQLIDLQTGFGMANIVNPAFETQVPIFGFFLFLIAVLYLFILNGHHEMVRAIASSYEAVPFGAFRPRPDLLLEVARSGREMFLDGLMIAAPVATAMLLAYATMGILSRLIPQIHLFVVGFPFTIALGLFVMAFSIGMYLTLLDGMFWRMFKGVETAIRGMV
ncbi:MAG: flagellar biosynthetic protein FliR [Candidatus Hydrogenedentes bacterium]|nr:flagellar biosynthetic protein FliR [Candidatus Hydrogenedentota bacterium]